MCCCKAVVSLYNRHTKHAPFKKISSFFYAILCWFVPTVKRSPQSANTDKKKNPHWQIVSADLGHRARGLHMVKSMVRGRDFPLCQLWDHHSCCNNMMFLQARLCITVRILYALTFSFTSLCTVLDYLAKVLRYLHVLIIWVFCVSCPDFQTSHLTSQQPHWWI